MRTLSAHINSLRAWSACFGGSFKIWNFYAYAENTREILMRTVCSGYASAPDAYAQRTHQFPTRMLTMFWRDCAPSSALFLCFINDLPRATDLFSVLYADDTTGLDSDSDLGILMTRVSVELKKMSVWFQCNKMALNINKTNTSYSTYPPKSRS